MRIPSLLLISAAALFFLIPHSPDRSSAETEDICLGMERSIVVAAHMNELFLCGEYTIIGKFRIVIGSNGTGKKIQGDRKTPLGTYTLGPPRPSDDFYIFIPIGYPTETQRENGYTGSAIGIHGPRKYFEWVDKDTTLYNWTQGCIATGTRDEIERITQWAHNNVINTIHIINTDSYQPPRTHSANEKQGPYCEGDMSIEELEMEMKKAAASLEFERAAELRDRIKAIKKKMLGGII
jgi:hypothetical protein